MGGVHEGRTALPAELRALDAACQAAGIEPAYVLLRGKRAFLKAWQDRRPTVDEATEHLNRSSKHAVGVQPASLGCVVLDSDDGEPKPEAIEKTEPTASKATDVPQQPKRTIGLSSKIC